MAISQEQMKEILVFFRKRILSNLTEDLKREFTELQMKEPIENCYIVFPVQAEYKHAIYYWKMVPDLKLTSRLKDYLLACFENAKKDKFPHMV